MKVNEEEAVSDEVILFLLLDLPFFFYSRREGVSEMLLPRHQEYAKWTILAS